MLRCNNYKHYLTELYKLQIFIFMIVILTKLPHNNFIIFHVSKDKINKYSSEKSDPRLTIIQYNIYIFLQIICTYL